MSREKKPVVMTKAKVNRLKQDITYKTLVMFIACAMDEMDWGMDQVADFSVRLKRYMDAVDTHLISIHQVAKIVEEVTGMEIRKDFK